MCKRKFLLSVSLLIHQINFAQDFYINSEKIVPFNATGQSNFGDNFEFSKENTMIIGGLFDNKNTGAIWLTKDRLDKLEKIVPSNNIGQSFFGRPIMFLGDSNRVAIAGVEDNSQGSVWLYSYEDNELNFIQKLSGTTIKKDNVSWQANYGYAMAYSNITKELAVGGYFYNNGVGRVWFYKEESPGKWVLSQPPIDPVNMVGTGAWFGYQVDFSNDGNFLAISGRSDNLATGAVWLYKRDLNKWTFLKKLVPANANIKTFYGDKIKFSEDSQTLAIGGFRYSKYSADGGGVWLYQNNGGSWDLDKILISPAFGKAEIYYGSTIKFSKNNENLAIGGYAYREADNKNAQMGIMTIYKKDRNGKWDPNSVQVLKPDTKEAARFSWAIEFTNDGKLMAVGAPFYNQNKGAIFIYPEINGQWNATLPQKLFPFDTLGNATYFGDTIRFSGDDEILGTSGFNDNSGQGAVYVFFKDIPTATTPSKIPTTTSSTPISSSTTSMTLTTTPSITQTTKATTIPLSTNSGTTTLATSATSRTSSPTQTTKATTIPSSTNSDTTTLATSETSRTPTTTQTTKVTTNPSSTNSGTTTLVTSITPSITTTKTISPTTKISSTTLVPVTTTSFNPSTTTPIDPNLYSNLIVSFGILGGIVVTGLTIGVIIFCKIKKDRKKLEEEASIMTATHAVLYDRNMSEMF